MREALEKYPMESTQTIACQRPSSGAMKVRVRVVDIRDNYGYVEMRVEPLEGSGHAWVRLDAFVDE